MSNTVPESTASAVCYDRCAIADESPIRPIRAEDQALVVVKLGEAKKNEFVVGVVEFDYMRLLVCSSTD